MTASTWTVPSPAGTITGVPQDPPDETPGDGTSNGHPAAPAFKRERARRWSSLGRAPYHMYPTTVA